METTHYVIVDKDGNAASVTTTLNNSYGSLVVVEGAGFLLNDEMDDFSVKPGNTEFVWFGWRKSKCDRAFEKNVKLDDAFDFRERW